MKRFFLKFTRCTHFRSGYLSISGNFCFSNRTEMKGMRIHQSSISRRINNQMIYQYSTSGDKHYYDPNPMNDPDQSLIVYVFLVSVGFLVLWTGRYYVETLKDRKNISSIEKRRKRLLSGILERTGIKSIDRGVKIIVKGKNEEAREYFENLLKEHENSENPSSDKYERLVRYYLGLCFERLSVFDKSMKQYVKVLEKNDDINAMMRLIPLLEDYQQSHSRTDEMIKKLELLKSKQNPPLECVRRCEFMVDGKRVIGYQYFDLTKTYTGWYFMKDLIKYEFHVSDFDGVEYRISLGSYEKLNEAMKIPLACKRIFHLDMYRNGKHTIFDTYSGYKAPDWYAVKDAVKKIVKGEMKKPPY